MPDQGGFPRTVGTGQGDPILRPDNQLGEGEFPPFPQGDDPRFKEKKAIPLGPLPLQGDAPFPLMGIHGPFPRFLYPLHPALYPFVQIGPHRVFAGKPGQVDFTPGVPVLEVYPPLREPVPGAFHDPPPPGGLGGKPVLLIEELFSQPPLFRLFPFLLRQAPGHPAGTQGYGPLPEKKAVPAEPIQQGPVMAHQEADPPVACQGVPCQGGGLPIEVIGGLIHRQQGRLPPEGNGQLKPFPFPVAQGLPTVGPIGPDSQAVHKAGRGIIGGKNKLLPEFGDFFGTLGAVKTILNSPDISRAGGQKPRRQEQQGGFSRAVFPGNTGPARREFKV